MLVMIIMRNYDDDKEYDDDERYADNDCKNDNMRYSDCKDKKNNKTVRKSYEMKSKLYCIYRDALGIKYGGPMGLTT